MDEFESLSHSKWECKYHVVFIPEVTKSRLNDIDGFLVGTAARRRSSESLSFNLCMCQAMMISSTKYSASAHGTWRSGTPIVGARRAISSRVPKRHQATVGRSAEELYAALFVAFAVRQD